MTVHLPRKGIFAILTSLSFFTIISTSAQNLENPGEYMTAISKAQGEMNKSYMAYLSAAAHSRRARKIEKKRNQALEAITNCRYKITDLPYYKGDNSLRKSSIDYVALCYKVFNEDYAQIVNMEEIAEQSFDQMQAYLLLQEKTSEKLKEAADKMEQATKDFAAKYNVTLIDSKSELGNKMEAAGKLNRYHNKVYLAFFKCNWQDGQIVEAMNKKSLNNLEQSRNALISYANEGLAVLDTMKHFEGDAALAIACKQALNFYKKMAENDLAKLTDYYLKQENFEKMKKSFDAKGGSGTKEEVDAFNKAVKEINAAINSFNQTNAAINNGRNQAVQSWANTEKNYMDAHMPYAKG